jgi:hypothetical protein
MDAKPCQNRYFRRVGYFHRCFYPIRILCHSIRILHYIYDSMFGQRHHQNAYLPTCQYILEDFPFVFITNPHLSNYTEELNCLHTVQIIQTKNNINKCAIAIIGFYRLNTCTKRYQPHFKSVFISDFILFNVFAIG